MQDFLVKIAKLTSTIASIICAKTADDAWTALEITLANVRKLGKASFARSTSTNAPDRRIFAKMAALVPIRLADSFAYALTDGKANFAKLITTIASVQNATTAELATIEWHRFIANVPLDIPVRENFKKFLKISVI